MAFVLPTFNISVNIQSASTPPPTVSPRLTLNGQLRAPSANNATIVPVASLSSAVVLLLPPGTDIRDPYNLPINSADWVEAPAGTGRWYRVAYVDDIGRGFPNEHRFAILIKTLGVPWPTPSP